MKGVAERTLELLNEFQKGQYIKSYRDFQHFLVVKIETLEDENESLKGVWEKEEHRCPQCGTGNPRLAQLEDEIVLKADYIKRLEAGEDDETDR